MKALLENFPDLKKDSKIYLTFFITSLILSVVLPSVLYQLVNYDVYQVGTVAPKTIKAYKDFLVEETQEQFDKRKSKIIAQSEKVFTLTFPGKQSLSSEIESVFSLASTKDTKKEELENSIGVEFRNNEWKLLSKAESSKEISKKVLEIVIPLLRTGVIINKRELINSFVTGREIKLRDLALDNERSLNSTGQVYDLQEALSIINTSAPVTRKGRAYDRLILKFSRMLLRPNLVFDALETDKRINDSMGIMDKAYFQVKKNDTIVQSGQKVTKEQHRKLTKLTQSSHTSEYFETWVAYFFLSFIILFCSHSFSVRLWPVFLNSLKDIVLICSTLVFSFLFLKLFIIIAESLSKSLTFIDSSSFALASPFAAGAVMLQVTIGSPAVFLFLSCFMLYLRQYGSCDIN